eukprot:m.100337 g.100337  ORF g.100337 m.100337 type:complete len:115 (+) comp13168_c2_seq2:2825-3169(+)
MTETSGVLLCIMLSQARETLPMPSLSTTYFVPSSLLAPHPIVGGYSHTHHKVVDFDQTGNQIGNLTLQCKRNIESAFDAFFKVHHNHLYQYFIFLLVESLFALRLHSVLSAVQR